MTSSTAHTAGPWVAEDGYTVYGEAKPDMMDYRVGIDMPAPFTENEYGGFEHFETQRGAIAFGRTSEEAKANARLIAAAPELLAALEYARNHIMNPDNTDITDLYRTMNSAIAAAKGGAA